jgi:biotin-dependent carboxylase-like uncharacterized protein
MIVVVKPGLLSTVQDLGRPGYAHLGVAHSGALDPPALIAANRLVGNQDGAAAIETTLTGVSVRAEVDTTAAVAGAPAQITVDGVARPFGAAVTVPAGAVFEVGPAITGVRSYVAFAGGVTVAPVLGSRSTDTLSGLGPPPLRAGFAIPLGRSDAPTGEEVNPDDPAVAAASEPAMAGPDGPGEVSVRIRMGPRHDWFSVTARDALLSQPYQLSVKTNRIGARLTGPVLSRAVAGELPSEPLVLGAVQVPSDGQPLVFLADHPTTGGYPVMGVVETADLPLLAQARPGTAVRFLPWT